MKTKTKNQSQNEQNHPVMIVALKMFLSVKVSAQEGNHLNPCSGIILRCDELWTLK
ncbi:MAG: hypothetical protein IPH69_01850 [Bacteroidales bacterium]|nr:hypothetical protein [Bacteroidales bacterium]